MPRRLDPKKGLPGLFAPGRPKTQEMAFLVKEKPPARAPRARAARPVPVPAPASAPSPVPDYIRLAPPFRAVPVRQARDPLTLQEIPSLLACALDWLGSAFRNGPGA
jgi:hypothetical protein